DYPSLEETSMATLTIQNVPENLVERIRSAADHNRRSMEQELRALIESRFAGKGQQIPARSDNSKEEALRRIRERWKDLPETTADEIDRWRKEGRTGQKVVTFDGGMLLKFPEWTISVSDFIASSRDTL
ncbi:MAG TPA: hypothetical protein VFC23_08250, partial [Thermoanaerobaculia bacterium]|nr:hypothetical protein [Thermoanaerobaculia bacterium]